MLIDPFPVGYRCQTTMLLPIHLIELIQKFTFFDLLLDPLLAFVLSFICSFNWHSNKFGFFIFLEFVILFLVWFLIWHLISKIISHSLLLCLLELFFFSHLSPVNFLVMKLHLIPNRLITPRLSIVVKIN